MCKIQLCLIILCFCLQQLILNPSGLNTSQNQCTADLLLIMHYMFCMLFGEIFDIRLKMKMCLKNNKQNTVSHNALHFSSLSYFLVILCLFFIFKDSNQTFVCLFCKILTFSLSLSLCACVCARVFVCACMCV